MSVEEKKEIERLNISLKSDSYSDNEVGTSEVASGNRKNKNKNKNKKKITKKCPELGHLPPSNEEDVVTIFGSTFTFPSYLPLLLRLSGLFGFMDVYNLEEFGLFATTMTGNLVKLIIYFSNADWVQVNYTIALILAYVIGGCWLSCSLLYIIKDRRRSLSILMMLEVAVSLAVGLTPSNYNKPLSVGFAFVNGGIFHWATKSNYNIALHGTSMQRIQESLFRFVNGLTQGGKKMRGDHLTSLLLISAFILGGTISALFGVYLPVRPWIIFVYSLFIGTFEGDMGFLSPHNHEWYRNFFSISMIERFKHHEYIDVWETDLKHDVVQMVE